MGCTSVAIFATSPLFSSIIFNEKTKIPKRLPFYIKCQISNKHKNINISNIYVFMFVNAHDVPTAAFLNVYISLINSMCGPSKPAYVIIIVLYYAYIPTFILQYDCFSTKPLKIICSHVLFIPNVFTWKLNICFTIWRLKFNLIQIPRSLWMWRLRHKSKIKGPGFDNTTSCAIVTGFSFSCRDLRQMCWCYMLWWCHKTNVIVFWKKGEKQATKHGGSFSAKWIRRMLCLDAGVPIALFNKLKQQGQPASPERSCWSKLILSAVKWVRNWSNTGITTYLLCY